jgi:hypothetical protein
VTGDDWPSVAVVVPNHSRITELEQTLASIDAQDYPGRIHVYLVYLPRPEIDPVLARLGPGVTGIPSSTEDGRNSIAVKRNLGLRASSEDLVAFLDDDDLWHPRKLRAQVAAMGEHPVAIAVSATSQAFREWLCWSTFDLTGGLRDYSSLEVAGFRGLATSSILVDGPTARRLEFDERPEWKAAEDYDFKLRLDECGPMRQMADILIGYRTGPTSISMADPRAMTVKSLDILASAIDRGESTWQRRLVAMQCVTEAIFSGRQPASKVADHLLDRALDGRVAGRLDPWLAGLVRFGWRCRLPGRVLAFRCSGVIVRSFVRFDRRR